MALTTCSRIFTSAPRTRPGKYSSVASKRNAGGRKRLLLSKASLTVGRKVFKGFTADDVIYLIMIDRFADGDATNNNPPGSPREANDRHNPRGFHGGDLRGIIDRLPYLKISASPRCG